MDPLKMAHAEEKALDWPREAEVLARDPQQLEQAYRGGKSGASA